jgi:hypothetical protein
MELTELALLDQSQLINLINRATVHLEYENYGKTHLYVNGQHAEPKLWFDASK